MTHILVAVKTAILFAVAGILAYALVNPGMEVTWNHIENGSTPIVSAVPPQILMDEAAAGRTCTTKPSLTDHIIFTYENGQTRVVDFDEAYKASVAKTGYARLYCK